MALLQILRHLLPPRSWLETELDPTDLAIKTWLNGELKQDARTSDMVYNPYEILSYISHSSPWTQAISSLQERLSEQD